MILPYNEIKEAVADSLNNLNEEFNYSLKNTLYAIIGDYDFSEEYSQTDECCIYIFFAAIALQKNSNINFMKEKLFELLKEENFETYKINLEEDFSLFLEDVGKLKSIYNFN